jgi:hypothetical protein
MSKAEGKLTAQDILPLAEYETVRKEKRAALIAIKKLRRVEVGPYATFYFESYETMWHQVHEMMRIEKGGAGQLEGELSAFNPLIPKGAELIATMMIEVDDPMRRANVLARLGGIEETIFFDIAGTRIKAVSETEVERTTADGKTSAVHFFHFPFTADQTARFKDPATPLMLGIGHENYAHLAVISAETRKTLAADFTA